MILPLPSANFASFVSLLQAHLVETAISGVGTVVLWQLRWLIFDPAISLYRYLVSEEFRDRWHLAGTYYIYHNPIINGPGAKIRLSLFEIKLGVYRSGAVQRDWKRSNDSCYKGQLDFSGAFVAVEMEAVVERYRANKKYILLHRPYRGTADIGEGGICGKMMGISNNNEIYSLPILLSKRCLSHDVAQAILASELESNIGVATKNRVRELIEAACEQDFEAVKNQFHSPFS